MNDPVGLLDELGTSQDLGFLGPGPVSEQIHHAEAFLPFIDDDHHVLDLGSGGGLPGLVLAVRTGARLTLLDSMQRRCRFLEQAVTRLGLHDRVDVLCARAEQAAHLPHLRGRIDTVVSRSFGPPAVAAECAAGFLRAPGGQLIVSEPPSDGSGRWQDHAALAELHLEVAERISAGSATLQRLIAVAPCPDRFPRRVGVPAKRPLF